jgi:hypothetical protein
VELQEPAGDAEPARPPLVIDPQLVTAALEPLYELFERMQIVGDRAVVADLTTTTWFGNGD